MSFGNYHSGGRTRMKTRVILNIYDLSPANDYLFPLGLGLHHSGVEISGREYTFADSSGIFDSQPRDVPNAKYRLSVEIGFYDGGLDELQKAIDELKVDFHSTSYHLLKRNCNHFANALCWILLGKTIPAYVNRLADVSSCCSCLFPRDMIEHDPSGAGGGGSSRSGGSGGGTSSFGNARPSSSSSSSATMKAFSGSGMTLGSNNNNNSSTGTSSSSSSSSSSAFGITRLIGGGGRRNHHEKNGDDLTDRREKARKAALARLERSGDSSDVTQ